MGLGEGDPMEPLPSPSITHGIVFYGTRWNSTAAMNWCRMHGYDVSKKVDMNGRFKLVVHPANVFIKNQFKSFDVCKDVKIIIGTRMGRTNERRVRMAMRSAG